MTALQAAGGGHLLALHIPHVVEQVGSVAGFASVIGLAILSALYFSQARDLRRLREWAGRAPERAAEGQPAPAVPGRVIAVPQRPAAPAPAAAPGNGEPAKAAESDGGKPAAASNGDVAPSVTAPAAEKDSKDEGDEPEEGQAAAAKPGMPAPASAAAAAAGAGAKSVTAPATTPGSAPGSTGPAAPGSPAGGGAAQPGSAGAAAPGSPAAAAAGAAAPSKPGGPQAPAQGGAANAPGKGAPQAPGQGAPRPAQPQRPPGSVLPPRTGTLPPVRRLPSSNVAPPAAAPPPKKKRNPVYVVLAVAGVLVLGAAAAIGVPKVVNGSSDNGATTTTAKKSAAAKKKAAPVAPDKITVAVLNGTSIPGLAAQVGDRVDAEGFTLGTVSNAAQAQGQRATSVAMYAPGHLRDANSVAKRLGIRNVTKIDSGTQQIAGDASVVVIVGSDKTQ